MCTNMVNILCDGEQEAIPILYSERNYSDIENLLVFYFLQKYHSKSCKTVCKRKSYIWNLQDQKS